MNETQLTNIGANAITTMCGEVEMKKRGHITINRILSYFNKSEVSIYLDFDLHTRKNYQMYLSVSQKNHFKPSPPSEWIEKKELMSYTQIARILNLSANEIRKIEQTALRKIRIALG